MANIFALRDSSLNAFLFSEVGTEANGTKLTILSLLARLGKDPWVEAAAWAGVPKNTAITLLTGAISQMPPSQQALDDAHMTAVRLVALLPGRETDNLPAFLPPVLATIPKSAVLVFVFAALFLVCSAWLTVGPRSGAIHTLPDAPIALSPK